MADALPIEVDLHEPELIRHRLRELGAATTSANLVAGDYLIPGRALIERKHVRKHVRDLHLTLMSGRLWSQLCRLRARTTRPLLLVEGMALDAGPVAPAAIRGTLLAIAELGITIIRSESPTDSAMWIYRVAARAERVTGACDRPVYAPRPKERTPRAAAEAALASIPSISTVTARELLGRFGTLGRVAAADQESLSEVPGVGPVRAARLLETLNHSHSDYRSRPRRERPGPST